MEHSYTKWKHAFSHVARPFAWVDLDAFDENIHQVLKRAKGKPVRIATKSIRSVPLIRRVLETSASFCGLMTYSAEETLWLSTLGLDDLLIGYPCWEENAIVALGREMKSGKKIRLMIDSERHVHHLNAIGEKHDLRFRVCLDLDMSRDFPGVWFGVTRSPLRDSRAVLELWEKIRHSPHVKLEGVMGYEAAIAGVGDDAEGQFLKNQVVRLLKSASASRLFARRRETVEQLRANGADLQFVNGGGTGSIEATLLDSSVTEITAGSAFFSPTLFDSYRDFRHRPAAGFALDVVRIPEPGIYTCFGGGYIASGSAGPEKLPQPWLPKGGELLSNEGAGEVQTPVAYEGKEHIHIGDPWFFRHAKAGELCERFNHLHALSGGERAGEWLTYRGEGKSFG